MSVYKVYSSVGVDSGEMSRIGRRKHSNLSLTTGEDPGEEDILIPLLTGRMKAASVQQSPFLF